MSCSRSVDSSGEVVASATPDLQSSPSSLSQQPCPVTPGGEPVTPFPQNPFDSFEIPPLPSLSQSGSLSDAFPLQRISSVPEGTSSNKIEQNQLAQVANSAEKSISPDRISQIQSPMPHGSPTLLQTLPQTPAKLASCEKSVSSVPLIPSTTPHSLHHTTSQTPDQFLLSEHQSRHSPQRHQTAVQDTALPTTLFIPSSTQQPPINFDDDEKTEPSSANNTAEHPNIDFNGAEVPLQQNSADLVAGSIMRFFQDTRRRMGSKDGRRDSDGDNMQEGSLISGFLQKYGRNGKWQTRWFETDGECLSYYKNSKRSKLLATLDLEKVGTIEVDPDDSRGRSFTIQVLGRMYHLRADSSAACRDWVITLNRVKEARLQQGNVKLYNRAVDLLDTDDVTPRVVVVANRQRTRAVDETEQWDQLYQMPADPADPTYIEQKRLLTHNTSVVGRWSKRHSSLQRLGSKLAQWARSVKKFGCQNMDGQNVYLDSQVHPPGQSRNDQNVVSPSIVTSLKAGKPKRSMSSASEDVRTIS